MREMDAAHISLCAESETTSMHSKLPPELPAPRPMMPMVKAGGGGGSTPGISLEYDSATSLSDVRIVHPLMGNRRTGMPAPRLAGGDAKPSSCWAYGSIAQKSSCVGDLEDGAFSLLRLSASPIIVAQPRGTRISTGDPHTKLTSMALGPDVVDRGVPSLERTSYHPSSRRLADDAILDTGTAMCPTSALVPAVSMAQITTVASASSAESTGNWKLSLNDTAELVSRVWATADLPHT